MYKEKLNFLKVTTTTYYAVPMINKKVTRINGWSIKDVIKDWFKTHTIDRYHATRDGHRVGNTNVVHKIEVVDMKEYEKQMKKQDKSREEFTVDYGDEK